MATKYACWIVMIFLSLQGLAFAASYDVQQDSRTWELKNIVQQRCTDNYGNALVIIVHPSDGGAIFDNTGTLHVEVAIAPGIRNELSTGSQIEILLDNQLVERSVETRFVFHGIDRGTHSLQARIVDRDGNVLIDSDLVSFHMWHASRLFPNRH
jgi:hypothetical protein